MQQDDWHSRIPRIGKDRSKQGGISREEIDIGVAESGVKLYRQLKSSSFLQGNRHAVVQENFRRQTDAALPFDQGFELLKRLAGL